MCLVMWVPSPEHGMGDLQVALVVGAYTAKEGNTGVREVLQVWVPPDMWHHHDSARGYVLVNLGAGDGPTHGFLKQRAVSAWVGLRWARPWNCECIYVGSKQSVISMH